MSRYHTYTCPNCGGHSMEVSSEVQTLTEGPMPLDGYAFKSADDAQCTRCNYQGTVRDFSCTPTQGAPV